MSDIASEPPSGATEITSQVPQWRPTSSLDALQELVDVAGAVPAAVARRAVLSTSELHALRHLMAQPLGPAELARELGITSAASSGVVDRLVARGHAQRRPHPLDGRRTEVVVTDSGRTEIMARLALMFGALPALDEQLSESERAVVVRYLTGAIAAMRTLL